jgi:hypothetical protein
VRRIRWVTQSDGAQLAEGEGWSAVVRACSAGGYEAEITTGDRVESYPRSRSAGDGPMEPAPRYRWYHTSWAVQDPLLGRISEGNHPGRSLIESPQGSEELTRKDVA